MNPAFKPEDGAIMHGQILGEDGEYQARYFLMRDATSGSPHTSGVYRSEGEARTWMDSKAKELGFAGWQESTVP